MRLLLGLAATLAKSEAIVELNKFSHTPVEVAALTEAFPKIFKIFTTNSKVTADADIFAEFTANFSLVQTQILIYL